MKKLSSFFVLTLFLSCLSFGAISINGGFHGGSLGIGISSQPLSYNQWLMGYGIQLSNNNSFSLYMELDKFLPKRTKTLPMYLSWGPELNIESSKASVGGFFNVGWLGIFDQPNLTGNLGLNIIFKDSGMSTGINAKLGFRL
jgi:hypothetical protein